VVHVHPVIGDAHRAQRVTLSSQVLIVRRHAGVTDQQTVHESRPYRFEGRSPGTFADGAMGRSCTLVRAGISKLPSRPLSDPHTGRPELHRADSSEASVTPRRMDRAIVKR
jgi:hypothetical protein